MVLFVCSLGKLRSRTAELLCLFGGLEARCCGTNESALYPVNDNLLREAELVVCMEAEHAKALREFSHFDADVVVTLGIRDVYNRLDPRLVDALICNVRPHSAKVAEAMERGARVLEGLPGYRTSLGTASPLIADNEAFLVFPSR